MAHYMQFREYHDIPIAHNCC